MILITGSAGKTGRAIIQTLPKSKETVRALVHRLDQVAMLEALGVEDVLVGNMLDPICISQAVQGVRAIYHISPNVNPDEMIIGKNIIRAAQAANVEQLVFHSVLHPHIEAMPHHWQKLRVEELLFESGLFYTILQPTVYMQNVLVNWDLILNTGIFPLPYSPQTSLSLVDLLDVSRVAAMVLTEPGHQAATYELVGTPGMSQINMADVLSEQLDRPVTAKAVPLEEWERGARSAGLGDYQVSTLINMFSYYERYGFVGNSNVLSYLLRRQPTSFTNFVSRIKSERENDF
jgi:NAD(P)H dehydrogenase (quinone)